MNLFLTFSDAAKFADIARNLINGLGYGAKFTFWGGGTFELVKHGLFPSTWTPPLMPLFIAGFFKTFGISDITVIATSIFFFILLVLFTYLLGNRLFGRVAGLLSALAVASNINLIDYATSGASELLFAFEIVIAAYLITLKKKRATLLTFIFMVLMYFTRPQAFIYIAGLILYWLLIIFKNNKAIIMFLGVLMAGFLVDHFILSSFAGKYFIYPIIGRGEYALKQITTSGASSDALRGAFQQATSTSVIKIIFYNLYNFYRLLPQIASPYLWAFFIIGLLMRGKDKIANAFRISVIFIVLTTFLATALTIPLFRYLHPVIPFVYISAVATLVWIVEKMVSDWLLVAGGKLRSQITSHRSLITGVMSTTLICFFVVGQTLGVIFLDSRFEKNTHNVGKPPVYVVLSRILKDNTMPDQIIITNLDTWGSWYGERKTVWYPLTPGQIIPPKGERSPFDVIYLTSYLMDDENYYMGEEWRQIFENPKNPKDEFIAKNYKFVKEFSITADETFEKQSARAILLVKK